MKKFSLLILIIFSFINYTNSTMQQIQEKKIVVLIPSYNNQRWYKKNLDSVFEQEYSNYRVIYIDDCSPDDTANLVEKYLKENKQENRTLLIKNKKRVTAMENIYKGIHFYCEDDEIVVKLDGDDWFAHSKVLARINQEYQDHNVWLTYGNYIDEPMDLGNYEAHGRSFCKKLSPQTLENQLRDWNKWGDYLPGHLLTFYAWLFKKIELKDLMYAGKIAECGYDSCMNPPMIEMAKNHHQFIQDILYIHNVDNPINDNRVNYGIQGQISKFNLKRVPYLTLESAGFSRNNEEVLPIIFSSGDVNKLLLTLQNLKNSFHNFSKVIVSIEGSFSRDSFNQCYTIMPEIIFMPFEKLIKQTLLSIMNDNHNEYLLVLDDNLPKMPKMDLYKYVDLIEETGALGLLFDMYDSSSSKSVHVALSEDVYAIQVMYAQSLFNHLLPNIGLFKKSYLAPYLYNAPGVKQYLSLFANSFDGTDVLLCLDGSKLTKNQ